MFPSLRAELFEAGDRPRYCRAKIETHQVKPRILGHPEFKSYARKAENVFDEWRAAHEPMLKGLKVGAKPKQTILKLSEDMLERFSALRLLDRYDIYQRLMDYWAETMQDDVYLVGADGWLKAVQPRVAIDNKEKKISETPDLVIGRKKYKMDLVPPTLIVARYFASEQAEIEGLEAKCETAEREMEGFVEEHSGEEGLFGGRKEREGQRHQGIDESAAEGIRGRAGERSREEGSGALSEAD